MKKLTAALAWAGLVSCASADEAALGQIPQTCFETTDCAAGFICVAQQCVREMSGGPLRVFVEVTPPGGFGLVRAQYLDLDVSPRPGGLTLEVPAPVEYEVSLIDERGGDARPVAARLSVFGEERIPEREMETSQLLSASPAQPQRLRLLEGSYGARLRPLDDALPPFEVSDFTVRAGGRVVSKVFTVPERFRALSGYVRDALSSEPIPGAIVRGYSRGAGLPTTVAVSTASTAPEGAGYYRILMPETAETFFWIEAEPPPDTQPTWGYRELIRVQSDRTHDIDLERAGEMIRGVLTFTVVGLGPMGPEPVRDAFVTVTSTSDDARTTRTFGFSGRTNARGRLEIEYEGAMTDRLPLLNGKYAFSVQPPSSSLFATRTFAGPPLVQDTNGEGVPFDVQDLRPLKPRIYGTVSSARGAPVPYALVRFEPKDPLLAPAEVQADERGAYSADVEPGEHVVVVEPGTEDLPYLVIERRVSDTEQVDLRLPAAAAIGGVVVSAGQPLPRAKVELFVRAGGRTISVGRAQTDAEGRFAKIWEARDDSGLRPR